MAYLTQTEHRVLHFKKPAGTSRGVYLQRDVWYVRVSTLEHPDRVGLGECAPLPDLSPEAGATYEHQLQAACAHLEQHGCLDKETLRHQPSIRFGLETALRHLESGSFRLWNTAFARGEQGIPINGLIWMGSPEDMREQIRAKMAAGFRCLKLKIGACRFEDELALMQDLRRHFPPEALQVRVDANGAFSPAEAADKLQRLSELGLHSIEQPLKPGQGSVLAALIQTSPLPIALDEELIGVTDVAAKTKLLDELNPHFLVLKPTLHGGIEGCTEWIQLAEARHIEWWITSALESNIGLNAIAHWCATLNNPLHQGLGTGMLYVDNVDMPLRIEGEHLWYKD